jgi:hypothetical protein
MTAAANVFIPAPAPVEIPLPLTPHGNWESATQRSVQSARVAPYDTESESAARARQARIAANALKRRGAPPPPRSEEDTPEGAADFQIGTPDSPTRGGIASPLEPIFREDRQNQNPMDRSPGGTERWPDMDEEE